MITKITPKSHEEWLKLRTQGFGSSEVGALLNLNKYTTPYEAMRRKYEDKERANSEIPVAESENQYMKMGHWMEQSVAAAFEEESGHGVIKSSSAEYIVKNDIRPYTQASPDRTYWIDEDGLKHGKNSEDNKAILECKTTRLSLQEETDDMITVTDERGEHVVPTAWYCQLQYLMLCAGKEHGALAWIRLGAGTFDYAYIDRSEAFCEQMLAELDGYYEMYLNGTLPEMSGADIEKNFSDTASTEGVEHVGEECVQLVEEYKAANAELKSAKEKVDGVKTKILAHCGEKDTYAYGDTVLFTWKSRKAAEKIDTKTFKAEQPEMYAKYVTEGKPSRTLLVK